MILSIIAVSLGIVACIVCSNFFSSSEMSFSSCSELRLENSAEKKEKGADKALYIIHHFDEALSTILIGNNLVNIACSSLASVLIIMITGSDAQTWIGTVVVTILVIIFGETIPKIIAKKKPNILALKYAPIIRALMTIFYPLVWLVVKLVDLLTCKIKTEEEGLEEAVEELQSIIETAEDEGILEEDQSELLQNAIDFADTQASEVMTARVDMDAIDVGDDFDDILKVLNKTRYSRIPVYEDSIDNIIGILHLNHFYKALLDNEGEVKIKKLLLKPCFVYKTMKLPEVLEAMRKEKQHLAIVTDEYGGTAGVITMEDVLEEIVGDIWDENDLIEQEIVKIGDNEYEIDGDMDLHDFFDMVGLKEDDADEFDSETVGGWSIEMLEHYPEKGERFDHGNIDIVITEVDERRVEKLRVKVYN